MLKVVKLSSNAKFPTRDTSSSAELDLYSAYNYIIPPNEKCFIKTDLQLQMPYGNYGHIVSCLMSHVSWNNYISVENNIIDVDYRGSLKVVIYNHSDNFFYINYGDKIAQLICKKINYPHVKEYPLLNTT